MIEIYDLRRLPEEGATVDAPLEKEWLDQSLNDDLPQEDLAITALRPGHAHFEIHSVSRESGDPVVRVRGKIDANLLTSCVRCLADVEFNIACTPDLTLFPALPAEAKVELNKTALDEGTYSNYEVDLPSIVREALLLEVAMNPRCADEPACAARTEALIASVAAADSDRAVDPRWAALAQIKSKMS